MNPSWQLFVWSNSPLTLPPGIEYRLSALAPFKQLTKLSSESFLIPLKERLFALDLLESEGGVFIDFDLIPLTPIETSLHTPFVTVWGKQDLHYTGTPDRLSMAFIATTPHHPFFEKIREQITSSWEEIETSLYLKDLQSNRLSIDHHTTLAFDETIHKELDNKTCLVTLLPTSNKTFSISPIRKQTIKTPLELLSDVRSQIRHRDHYFLIFGAGLLFLNGLAYWAITRSIQRKKSSLSN